MSPWNTSSTVLDKSSPFDALAADYDRSFTHSAIGRAQRHAVWKVAQRVFQPGTRILELNCGTGVDAVYLARLGLKVTALDNSSQMIAVAQDRVRRERCQGSIRLMHWAIEDLDQLPAEAPYDGAFSNFGGLNCVPDLRRFGCDLARRLKPGSPVLLCPMGRYCIWEFFYYSLRWQFHKAVRRLKKDGVLATSWERPQVQKSPAGYSFGNPGRHPLSKRLSPRLCPASSAEGNGSALEYAGAEFSSRRA